MYAWCKDKTEDEHLPAKHGVSHRTVNTVVLLYVQEKQHKFYTQVAESYDLLNSE